ncbi:MAG: hypothetical protein CMF74_03275 [Maricaulis sp.]|jgi:N-acetylneuraminic acid mutarotase|nr:hypothetical protein [Maricaulis sp.]HAQ34642.1 hypothetical protein [Alphaproteobacteria bacterium]
MLRHWFVFGLSLAAIVSSAAFGDGEWSDGPRLQDPRSGLAAVEFEGAIYVAGGAGLTQPREEVEYLDLALGEWRDATPLPAGLERFGLATINGRIYAAGGYAAREGVRPIADMWSYDPASGVWAREPAMPGPKASFQLVATQDRLFAIGGETGEGVTYAFDPEAQEWEEFDAPEHVARRGASAVFTDGLIYLIGGARSGAASSRVDVLDPATGEWSERAEMPSPHAGHATAVVEGRIHVFGGRGADLSQTLSDHLVYDIAADRWENAEGLPAPRTDAAAAVIGTRIYLIGGGAGGGFFAPFTAVDETDIYSEGLR